MKKRNMISILFAVLAAIIAIGMNLYCKTRRESTVQSWGMMRINSIQAAMDLCDSNEHMIDLLYEISENGVSEQCIEDCDKAIETLVRAKYAMKEVIASPNSIEEEIVLLQTNYEKTLDILQKYPDISDKEVQEFSVLLEDGAIIHSNLIKVLQCFVNLCYIREFDSFPDEEARAKLEEMWWQFGFESTVKRPDTIDDQELYLIWAEQFAGEDLNQTIISKIETMREEDNLSSKEYNAKWIEVIQEICSTSYWDV